MNINPVVTIPSSVTFVLKYMALPVAFLVLSFAGLKDIPVLMIGIGLFFLLMELNFIPYDLGKTVQDDAHPYEYKVRATYFSRISVPLVTKYYSRRGLLFAKIFQMIPAIVIYGIITYLIGIFFWLMFSAVITGNFLR